MKSSKSFVLGGMGLLFGICAAFASAVVGERGWYNATQIPGVTPTVAVNATITNSSSNPALNPCTTVQSEIVCTINGRPAFEDQGLSIPLGRLMD